jgi:hypothetical protein
LDLHNDDEKNFRLFISANLITIYLPPSAAKGYDKFAHFNHKKDKYQIVIQSFLASFCVADKKKEKTELTAET